LALWLLALLPVLAVVAWRARSRRRRILAQLGQAAFGQTLEPDRPILRILRRLCLALGLTALILGIAGPRWGRDWGQAVARGRDLVVVLDASRSMLADDVLPSRLERAKAAVNDLSYEVERRGGHRLALVAFAGGVRLVCPLTHDYEHFRAAVTAVDAADLRPASEETASGTRMGAALRAAIEAHDERAAGYQDILMISDGDDPARDHEWEEGAEVASKHGFPVHTVGIGNPESDSPIPLQPGVVLRREGKPVQTRLHEQPLEEIARRTRGTYTPARTQALPLGELFRERIEPAAARETTEDALPLLRPRYAWFLGPALALLALEMAIGPLRGRRSVNRKSSEE
jgi:Ca-activated chloride channel family protein